MAEFAYNNFLHSATGYSPFYATYGYHPTLSFTPPTVSTVLAAKERVWMLNEVHEEIKAMFSIAREQDKKYYDREVQDQPMYKVSDYVLRCGEHIATTSPSKKQGPKCLGSFLIVAKLSDLMYRLKLSATLYIQNVFHVAVPARHHSTSSTPSFSSSRYSSR